MLTSPLRAWSSSALDQADKTKKAMDLESIAQLVEDLMPNFKHEEERRFYRELAKSYRAAAHDILRTRHRT